MIVDSLLGIYECMNNHSMLLNLIPGLVCHVENIALLVPLHQQFKQTIKSKAVPLQEGLVRLNARLSNDWIADDSCAGFPSFAGVGDLECMMDLFGKLTLQEAQYVYEPDLRSLTCKFSTADDRYILQPSL